MTTRLYLDTARLGRMCPEAQAAAHDFARLAGEEGCSLYFEQFLRWGFSALPPALAKQYAGLSFWAGVTAFERDLKSVLGVAPERQVVIANRSAQLVRLAARALCRKCENILVTDSEWPAYVQALEADCRRTGRVLTTVPVRDAVYRERITRNELVDRLVGEYCRNGCDGLFLSAVAYHGLRLPVREIVGALRGHRSPRFVVVDGAQALNHVPIGLASGYCDLLLTGCHKWLRAYQPLGLAICGRKPTESFVADTCREMLAARELDDPLLVFRRQLASESTEAYSETVNLAPLFTAAAAVRRMLSSPRPKREDVAIQIENADRIAERAASAGWRPTCPDPPLRSGILLLQSKRRETRSAPADSLRAGFLSKGVALTTYEDGLVRASMPAELLLPADADLLHSALCRCA